MCVRLLMDVERRWTITRVVLMEEAMMVVVVVEEVLAEVVWRLESC